MVNISTTKVSSKGQIVIPSELRGNLKEGDELLIIKDENRIILKKAENLSEEMKEDLKFAKRTELAWKEIDEGKGVTSSVEDFLKEMKKW
jgi:AbrB family looped-hinge helix DNA binding protein